MGLVKQCITSMYKKNIQRLTKVSCFTYLLELDFIHFSSLLVIGLRLSSIVQNLSKFKII